MASKRDQDSPDDAVHNLTAKKGVHNTTIRGMRELNQEYYNPLPVVLSGDNTKTQKDNSAVVSGFDPSGCVTSQASSQETELQSSTKREDKDTEGKARETTQLSINWATGDTSTYTKSSHIIGDTSEEVSDAKIKDSIKVVQRSRSIFKRSSPFFKSTIFKPIQFKTLQFKTQQIKPKTLSKVTVFKALQFKERSPKSSHKYLLKTVHFKDALLDSKQKPKKTLRFEDEIIMPLTSTKRERFNILKPLRFFGSNEPINTTKTECKPLPLGKRYTAKGRELKTEMTKVSEQSIVVKPLQFHETDTKLQPTYLEPTPGTSKLPSIPVKPVKSVLLKPVHFYQKAMGPIHFFDECETKEASILSPKLKLLAIPQSLQSKTEIETDYRPVVDQVKFTGDIKPIQLAVSIEPDTKHPRDVKRIESYPPAVDSVEFSEPVQSYLSSVESAESISKLSPRYPPILLSAECAEFSGAVQPSLPSVESAETREFSKLFPFYPPNADRVEFPEVVQPYLPSVDTAETREFSKLFPSYPPSDERVELSEPIQPYLPSVESAKPQEFFKLAPSYPPSAECVELPEPVQTYPPSVKPAETQEFSKPAPPYPPSAESLQVTSSTLEQATIEFPESITIETPSKTNITMEHSLNEQLSGEIISKGLFSGELSSDEHLNLLQKSNSSVTLKPSPAVCTKSDVMTSTRIDKKVKLDETVIDLSSLSIISSTMDIQAESGAPYETPQTGTSERFPNIEDDDESDDYNYRTDSEVKDILLSELMKSDTMLRNLSSLSSADKSVLIDIPEYVPNLSEEIHQEMMQRRRRVSIPYSMMTSEDSFVMTMKDITNSDHSVRTKGKKPKTGKIKKPDKTKPGAPKVKVKKRKWFQRRKNVFTKRRKNILRDAKVSTFSQRLSYTNCHSTIHRYNCLLNILADCICLYPPIADMYLNRTTICMKTVRVMFWRAMTTTFTVENTQ